MTMRPEWEEWNRSAAPKYPHEKVIQFCFRNFPASVRPHVRALDLGCGSGANTLFLAAEGFQVNAVDISRTGVANTKRLLTEAGLDADVRVAPIEAANFPPDSFDLVICVGVLDAAGPEASTGAVDQVAEIMSPGARALFLFASDVDFRVAGSNPLGLHGFAREEVDHLFAGKFAQVHRDVYVCTYEGGNVLEKNWLVTVLR